MARLTREEFMRMQQEAEQKQAGGGVPVISRPTVQPEQMMRAEAPDPAITQARAVRTEEAENAFRMGERLGAESVIGRHEISGRAAEEQGMPITEETLRKAEQTLLEYMAGKTSIDRRIISAQEWWKLHNWEMIEAERGTQGAADIKTDTAWLWNCIVGKHADMMDNFPEPVILPRMQDDEEEAKRLSSIVPVVLEMNGFEETYSEEQWQKLQEGTGCEAVIWNKDKLNGLGDIEIRQVSVLNLFWQPGIKKIQESRNLFYVTEVDNEELEEMYPQLKGRLKHSTITLKKYRTDDSTREEKKSAVVDWYYKKWNGTKRVLHYCKFVDGNILYSTENNGETEGLYADGNYPFVMDRLFPVEGQPTGYGFIDVGRGTQTDIDTLNQAMVKNAVAASTPRSFIRDDGSVNEDEYADWSKPFVHVNGNLGADSIQPIVINELSGNSISMLDRKIDELKFVTGNTDVQNGGVPSGVTAASAIAALKEDAGRSSKDTTRAGYRAYQEIVNMVIERIRQFYDIPRMFRILGETGEQEFVQYDNRGIKLQEMPAGPGMEEANYRLPVFDIEVHAARENATTRMSQNELALQFYQLGFFNPQMTDQVLPVLDMMDFKGKEKVRQRIQQNGDMLQALTQVGQIAVQLAQNYAPQILDQLTQMLQGIGAGIGPVQGGGAMGGGTAATMQRSATDKPQDPNENAVVTKAREQAANAGRVD